MISIYGYWLKIINTITELVSYTDLKVQDTGTFTCKAISETGETTWDAFLAVSSKLCPLTGDTVCFNFVNMGIITVKSPK